MSYIDNDKVKRVRQALVDAGLSDSVREIDASARSASEAALALGVEQGAIVKTLIFTIGNRFVMTLISGDHMCRTDQLEKIFQINGPVIRPTPDLVRAVTGFSIGAVSPAGAVSKLPCSIDANLKRFEKLYAAAGHTHCVFETTLDELKTLTGGTVSYALAGPMGASPNPAEQVGAPVREPGAQ